MRQIISASYFLLLTSFCRAQNIDSILAIPQTIELTVSTPQPRLEEVFQISIDINHLQANIFRSLAGKVQFWSDFNHPDNLDLSTNVKAIKKGVNEFGPLTFTLDKTVYTTNKISFEVVDALPRTDKGLWFRKVMTSDSTFCIIIEQRIPASNKTTYNSDNSISYTTEPDHREVVKFKTSYSISGVTGHSSNSRTTFGSLTIDGQEKEFLYGYAVFYFNIADKNARIKITKDKFDNIPGGYKFEDIIVQ